MKQLGRRIANLSAGQRALLELRLKGESGAAAEGGIPRGEATGPCPLSFGQQRLWWLWHLDPGSPAYNMPKAIRVRGALDVDALQKALDAVVARHEVLRTTFLLADGKPVQVVGESRPVPLTVVPLGHCPETEREAEVQRVLREETGRPFDLSGDLMLRAALLRLGGREHVLLLVTHHIASDAWSRGILFREIAALYGAFAAGSPSPLPELPVQYADFAQWQRDYLEGPALQPQVGYWRQQLGGDLPLLELPSDRPRPAVQSWHGARLSVELSPSVLRSLRALSRAEGTTLFMTLLAAFQTLLHRYSGQEDMVVGCPVAGRSRVETEGLIGFFANTLVLRTDLSGDPTFRELLGRVRGVALAAYEHQDLPFEKLVEELRPERSLSHTPLFQVMFVLRNAPRADPELPGLTLSPVEVDTGTARFDLTLSVEEDAGPLRGSLEYNTDLFDAATVRRMFGSLEVLLEGVVKDPDQRITELPLLTGAERRRVLREWNDTRVEFAQPRLLPEMIEEQARRSPEAEAVAFENERLTYGELNARANRLAHHLRAKGVGPDTLVGVCLERSVEMVVGVLAVLKAGGAYVPLDPSYPSERLGFMLKDTQAPVLLTQERLAGNLPPHGAQVVCLDPGWDRRLPQRDDDPAAVLTPEHLAYVIYTSGSTGRPKGVAMPHRPLVNLIAWQLAHSAVGPGGRTLQFTTLSFDVAFQEVFGTWCSGGTLVLIREEARRDLRQLPRLLEEQRIDRLFLPFVALQQLGEACRAHGRSPCGLKEVITAGEQLQITPAVAGMFKGLPGCTLHNHYGPTESHVVTAFSLAGDPAAWPSLPPIGRPIANARVYLLDRRLQPVPVGVAGELHIGGVPLARGYLNRPELTAERFIPDPFGDAPGGRLYKTGDRARWLADGNLEFLGRLDEQVKVRGYRIEPAEVEAVLNEHPAVRESAVVVREDRPGDKRLVGFVVLEPGQPPTARELREFAEPKLPAYMIPSTYVKLNALPLSPHGKTDRRLLQTAPMPSAREEAAHKSAGNPLQALFVEIWEDLLNVRPVGVRDNFFDLGGHSLLAVSMLARVEELTGRTVPLATLFAEPVIERLCCALAEQAGDQAESLLLEVQGGTSWPFFFLHGDFLGAGLYCRNLARHLGADQPFYALHPHGFVGERVPGTVEAMAAEHLASVRAVQPKGPYLLGGYCNGAVEAFEMAQQLRACGEEVALLLMIDPLSPNPASGQFAFQVGFQPAPPLAGHAPQLPNLEGLTVQARRRALLWFSVSACNHYVPAHYPGRITILHPSEKPMDDASPLWRWRDIAREVEVHCIPGGHSTAITRHVQAAAEQLRTCLQQARGRGE